VAIGGGYIEFAGWVPWLIHKDKADDQRQQHQAGLTDLTGGYQSEDEEHGLTGVRRRSSESLKWRTHIGIARLASRLSKFAVC
jgi:hypothetical protein